MSTHDELKKDVDELQSLCEQTTRPRVKDMLQIGLRKLQTELSHLLENQSLNNSEDKPIINTTPSLSVKAKPATVKVDTYAWDQSDKFMKIYATVNGVHSIAKENVKCEFTARGFKLNVNELNNKNYDLHINTLMEEIVPDSSYIKIKTDTVLVMLKKKEEKQTWTYVTEREKKSKEEKKPKLDNKMDPNDSLMTMLHQMYEDGDDEMKRTIAKSMYESRNKSGAGLM